MAIASTLPIREIRVLIAEDSPTVRWQLTKLINASSDLRVVGAATNGEELLEMAETLKPDVISMDIHMPRLDGLEATRQLMSRQPIPVVIVSSLLEGEVDLAFQALQAGALAVVEKPKGTTDLIVEADERKQQLLKTLRAMSSVRVIRRTARQTDNLSATTLTSWRTNTPAQASTKLEILGIGASAGGPGAINTLLQALPKSLNIPIVIAQHLPTDFMPGLARWLSKSTGWPVQVTCDYEILRVGVVHLLSGDSHLEIVRRQGQLIVQKSNDVHTDRYCPSIDVAFRSIAKTCGNNAVGVLLSGMGTDGAKGLLAIRQAGSRTFAQDSASAVVFGMPGAALECGAVDDVTPITQMANAITRLAQDQVNDRV
jgi:two-component system, chemotaxis family, protein-glutamate methylesterase/glutaminase